MAAAGPTIEHQYFYEDQVYRVNRKGHVEFGMVLENSELASSDENSDTDDGDLHRSGLIKKGHIRVAWHPSAVEEVIPERKVHLADRSLMPGDVVRRMIKGKDTQRGYCRDIRVTAAVQIVGTKHVFPNIKSDELVSIEEFVPDTASCLDSWVGAIKEVHSHLHLSFTDGSKCVINDIDACGLQGFEKKSWDSEFPSLTVDFYPGQVLCGPLSCLEQAEWVHCTKELKQERTKPYSKRVRVTVEEIKTHSVDLHWQCRAYSKSGVRDREQPNFTVQEEDLTRLRPLNIFEPCTLQVGDRRYYTIKTEDIIVSKEHWRRAQRDRIRPSFNTVRSSAEKEIVNNNPAAANNLTNQQLNLQQGELTPKSSPTINENQNHLIPTPPQAHPITNTQMIDQNTDDEYTTDDTASASDTYSNSSSGSQSKKKRGPALMTRVLKKKKLRRAKKRNSNSSFVPGTRVVVESLSTSSIADVVWQDGSVELGIPSTQLYPIHHLDDQEFFPGDFVIENKEDSSMRIYGVVQSVDHAGRTAKVLWFRTYTSVESPRPSKLDENEVSVYDLKDHPDFQYRPGTVVIRVANFEGEDVNCTAGQVLDNYPEGKVRVWWVDGHISMSWPQDLYKVGEYDSDEGEFWDGVSSSGSWETESENCFIADEDIGNKDPLQTVLDAILVFLVIFQFLHLFYTHVFIYFFSPWFICVLLFLIPYLSGPANVTTISDNEADASTSVQTSCRCHEENDGLIKPKLAANIEKARIAMSRLEEIFTQDPALQTTTIMRQMLDVYKDCRYLDRLMGTSFFHESHFQGLLERVRERGRPNLAQRVADQVSRLFQHSREDSPATVDPSFETSSIGENSQHKPNENFDSGLSSGSNKNSSGSSNGDGELACIQENLVHLEKKVLAAGNTTSPQGSAKKSKPSISTITSQAISNKDNVGIASSNMAPHSMVCVRLCSLIKAQLVEAHAEVTRRFGGGAQHMKLSDAVKSPTNLNDKINKSSDSMQMDTSENKISDNATKNSEEPFDDIEGNIEDSACDAENTDQQSEANEGFSIMDSAPTSHKFKLTIFQPTDPQHFFRTLRNELQLLKSSLPPGIWVKSFDDRMDLYSVMIRGPERTPYEDGLFLFDMQLSGEYPRAPPLAHYISYCSDRLNPNLYEDGKVCVSLLGTWSGKGTEVWTTKSNLLQVIVSIQGLILVSEPYFNEAGYEKQKGSQQGNENSRMYNEMAVLKLVQALNKLLLNPPSVFKEEIIAHFRFNASKMLKRLDTWLEISEKYNTAYPVTPTSPTNSLLELQNEAIENGVPFPEFPLIPASKGFCLTLKKAQATFRQTLTSLGILTSTNGENISQTSQTTTQQLQLQGQKIKKTTSSTTTNTSALTTTKSSKERIEAPLVIAEIPTASKTVTDIS